MQTNQNTSVVIEEASKVQTNIFIASVILAVVFAVSTAVISTLLFRAGNTYQEAVKQNADERIAVLATEAEALRLEAENAKNDTAKANERIAFLTSETEKAKVDTEKIRLKVEQESRKRAEAERQLLELQEKLRPRVLTKEKRVHLVWNLEQIPKGDVKVSYLPQEEPEALAWQLYGVFKEVGWTAQLVGTMFAHVPKGIIIYTPTNSKSLAEMLAVAIDCAGLRPLISIDNTQEKLILLIGVKP